MVNDERDLAPLDPEHEPAQWERMVGNIMSAAAIQLEGRARTRSPLFLLTDWLRPTLMGSAGIAAMAASVVLFAGQATSDEPVEVAAVAEGIGLPESITAWLDTGSPDALDNLVLVVEETEQ